LLPAATTLGPRRGTTVTWPRGDLYPGGPPTAAVGYDARQMEHPVQVPTCPGIFRLPPQLEGLRRLAYNMCGAEPAGAGAVQPHRRPVVVRYRNPVEVLSQPIAWSELIDDPAFMAECTQVLAAFDRYMAGGASTGSPRVRLRAERPIGYFCAEYGFHESLGIYSGGLGVLAGDHISPPATWRCVRRYRSALQARLLPSDDRRGRPSGACLPRLRPGQAPDPARARPGRRAADRLRRAARARHLRRRVAGPGGARAGSTA